MPARPHGALNGNRAIRGAQLGREPAAQFGEAREPWQTSAATTQARRARSPGSSARKGRAGSARTSRREQDVLRLVSQRPGITVSEIAKQLEVDPTGLYRPVHKLEQRGAISKQGAALQPANR